MKRVTDFFIGSARAVGAPSYDAIHALRGPRMEGVPTSRIWSGPG
ncbi:hypothetical protein [Luteolibacter sp. LG18]